MKTKLLGAAAAALLALSQVPGANAAIINTAVQTQTFSITNTNFSDEVLTFDKFDGSLGTLLSVNITLSGTVEGNAAYENTSTTSSANVTLNLEAEIDLTTPGGGTTLVQTIPVASVSEVASIFDGTLDFDGASGSSFTGLSGTASSSSTETGGAILALFTGAFGDMIDLELDAVASSIATGGGNIISQFLTNAGATATIYYAYDDGVQIAEPATLALLGAGLIGAGLRRRRKA